MRPDRMAHPSAGSDPDHHGRLRARAELGWSGQSDSTGRRRLVPAGREALAWRDADHRHDPHRNPGTPPRQRRRLDGEGQRRTIPGACRRPEVDHHALPSCTAPGERDDVTKGGQRDEDSPQGRSHASHRDAARKQGQPGLRLAAAADAHDERPLPAGEVRAPAEADLGGRQACSHVRGRTDRVLGPRAGRGDLLPPGRSADTRPPDRRPRDDQLRRRSFRCPWCHEGDHRAREVTLEQGESMRGAVLYAPRDVRFEEREEPRITKPTDAIIRMSATCVYGSDLWPYRGIEPVTQPTPFGHEYCGIVEEVGSAVESIKPGQFVIGSVFASDNTCPICRAGYQTSCVHREPVGGAPAGRLRGPPPGGTLVATPRHPPDDLIPSLLTLSDVMGTGWFAADAANVKPGVTAVVVGDGAVGLLAVLSAKQMGAGRIIAMSRHAPRQKLAREFCRHAGVDDAGDPVHPPGRIRELRRCSSWRPGRWAGAVLLARPPPRWPGPRAPLPARADRPRVEAQDQSRQGLRPDAASRASRGGLPRDG